MRVVAIRNDATCDGNGEPIDVSAMLSVADEDESVLVHDADAVLHFETIGDIAGRLVDGIEVVVGSWTFDDPDHGVVRRRGVLSTERVRWTNTAGPALLVRVGALRRSGWGSDGHTTLADLVLRLSEIIGATRAIASVESVLAHVDAELDAATNDHDLVAAVERHLARSGIEATVVPGEHAVDTVVVERVVPEGLTISVVVPTTGKMTDVRGAPGRLVVNLLDSMFAVTDLPRTCFDIVLVIGPEADADLVGILDERYGAGAVRFVRSNEPFCHSRRTNLGVLASSADVVVLLNDDTEVVSPGWLGQIAAAATEPGVGLVGPLLRYPDGTVQSAGHVHPPINIGERSVRVPPCQASTMLLGRDVSGVTLACAAVVRKHYLRAGGLSQRIHNGYNDVDLGMKLERLGLRHVSLGHVELIHLETATREPGVRGFERAVLEQRWASSMATERLHFTDRISGGDVDE
ncbi:MAG: glycosyltransferase family 2 protein [Ilumatobacter sp.]